MDRCERETHGCCFCRLYQRFRYLLNFWHCWPLHCIMLIGDHLVVQLFRICFLVKFDVQIHVIRWKMTTTNVSLVKFWDLFRVNCTAFLNIITAGSWDTWIFDIALVVIYRGFGYIKSSQMTLNIWLLFICIICWTGWQWFIKRESTGIENVTVCRVWFYTRLVSSFICTFRGEAVFIEICFTIIQGAEFQIIQYACILRVFQCPRMLRKGLFEILSTENSVPGLEILLPVICIKSRWELNELSILLLLDQSIWLANIYVICVIVFQGWSAFT